ncbi:MAG: hypothetical protein LBM23_00695 [Propionibacteriaceae bacterium]|jgi:hypothetical protein|nr:hypothetical protein [Propionibacteriaceae bacterium]
MGKILFGSPFKILYWVVCIGFLIAGATEGEVGYAGIGLFFLVLGPCIAIPGIMALKVKKFNTTRSIGELERTMNSVFLTKKVGDSWSRVSGDGDYNFKLDSVSGGDGPVITINVDDRELGDRTVSFAVSEFTHGGLNGGKGSPFWVWGGVRALNKIRSLSNAFSR